MARLAHRPQGQREKICFEWKNTQRVILIINISLTPDNRAQESSDYKTDYSPLDRNLNGPQKSTAVRRLANCRSHFLTLLGGDIDKAVEIVGRGHLIL